MDITEIVHDLHNIYSYTWSATVLMFAALRAPQATRRRRSRNWSPKEGDLRRVPQVNGMLNLGNLTSNIFYALPVEYHLTWNKKQIQFRNDVICSLAFFLDSLQLCEKKSTNYPFQLNWSADILSSKVV